MITHILLDQLLGRAQLQNLSLLLELLKRLSIIVYIESYEHYLADYMTSTTPSLGPKSLWDTLKKKYGLDDTGIKGFKASDFNKFKMVDSKSMNEQIHEFGNQIQ